MVQSHGLTRSGMGSIVQSTGAGCWVLGFGGGRRSAWGSPPVGVPVSSVATSPTGGQWRASGATVPRDGKPLAHPQRQAGTGRVAGAAADLTDSDSSGRPPTSLVPHLGRWVGPLPGASSLRIQRRSIPRGSRTQCTLLRVRNAAQSCSSHHAAPCEMMRYDPAEGQPR